MAAISASMGSSALGIRPRVLRISRHHAPKPITATLIFIVGALVSLAGAALVWANSSTPPSIVISVAYEPPLRKSRRLYPSGSFTFSLISVNSFAPHAAFWPRAPDFAVRSLARQRLDCSPSLFHRRLLRLGIHLLEAQRPFDTNQDMFLVGLGHLLGILAIRPARGAHVLQTA